MEQLRLLRARIIAVFGCCTAVNLLAATVTNLHVPPGFTIEKVAGPPETVFPMFAAFDERGRLFVAESSGLDLYAELTALTRKCRVRMLEDRDADGRYETARVFVDQLVFPMGLVWRGGKLYVADPPDLVTWEDTDGDGRADKRTIVLTGFGHKDNGSLHGLTFGPDGLLYLTMGSPDGYRLKCDDGTFVEGRSGALIRCRPDGSRVEVVCRGFVNLVEVVFLPTGEVIGTDNWYQHPAGGVRDALVHLVEGGLYPLERDVGTPQLVTGDPLPPLSLFPAAALSGMTIYRGPTFPSDMRGNLFSAQHNSRKVGRHVLTPVGSTFKSEDSDFVTSDDPDFHPSDVLEAPDGSLLVIDTGSWYVQHCPTGRIRKSPAQGGIYRVRYDKGASIDDPLGLTINWANASTKQLVELLGDHRPLVRDRAQNALILRGDGAVPALASALDDSQASIDVMVGAVWTLASTVGEASILPLRKALQDSNANVVIAAARSLALRNDRHSAPALCQLLNAENLHVRRAAAEALAHCGDANSLPSVWQALAGDRDRFLEHSLIFAAHRLADEQALNAVLQHAHPRVQKAALLLLDQPPRPRSALAAETVFRRAASLDAELRQTALRILQKHAEWAAPASALVEGWLKKTAATAEEKLNGRSLILAFQSALSMQQLIGEALRAGSVESRLFLLETIAQTSLPKLPDLWTQGIADMMRESNLALRVQALRTVAVLRLSAVDDPLRRVAENESEPLELRLEAMRALVARDPKPSAGQIELLLAQVANSANPVARLSAAEILRRTELTDAQLLRALKSTRNDALISPSLLLPAVVHATNPESANALVDELAERISTGWRPASSELERLKSSFATADDKWKRLGQFTQHSAEQDRAKLARFESYLTGGDADRGRAVFFSNNVACSICHAIGSTGGKVGPDLTSVGAIRSGHDLLESILLPSSTFAQGYDNYLVETTDGREGTGVIARQNAEAVVLRDSSGAETQFHQSQIKELRRLTTSIMPEGLEAGLTADEFRDLLAFLQNLK